MSLAKSGSTWFAELLAELPGFHKYQPAAWTASLIVEPNNDFYAGILAETRHRLAVVKGHTSGTKDNVAALHRSGLRYLITVRDPRDQIISGYWYLRNRPLHPAHQEALKLSLKDFITNELDPETAIISRADWLRGWIANRDPERSLLIRYEDLLDDAPSQLRRAFDFLGIAVHSSEIEQMVANNAFEAKTGRSRGEEDTGAFRRKGTSGEWRSVFTLEHRQQCERSFEDIIVSLGYEPTMADHL